MPEATPTAHAAHRRTASFPLAAVAALALWVGLALAPFVDAADAQYSLDPIASFSQSISVAATPADPTRLFVVQRTGRIGVVHNGQKLAEPFLRIPGGVSTDGERGLLSMAFHPAYEQNRKFYVFYTLPGDGDLQIDEFLRSRADPNRALRSSQRHVLRIEHSEFGNHNGGQLQFGRDRLLYISTGDGGGGGDPRQNAQDLSSLLGKVLRIDPRGRAGDPYDVPPENPFVGRSGRNEIWAYGLRNPFRFSFDRLTGDIAIGDVGQGTREEVDFRTFDQPSGANFGWSCFEGSLVYEGRGASCLRGPSAHTGPVLEYSNPPDSCASITGGYVVRDPTLEALQGRYIYGDYCSGDLDTAVLTTGGAQDQQDLGLNFEPFGLVSFGEDAAGHLHLVSLNGTVYRLTD